MRTKNTVLKRLSIVSFLLIIVFLSSSLFAQNILNTNGGFEDSEVDTVSAAYDIEGWYIEVAGAVTPAPVLEIVSDTVQEGERAFKVTVNAVGSNQWDIQLVADSIPVEPGETYVYSVWAKATNPGAQANFTVGNYAFSEYGAIRPANLTTQWQEFTMQFTISDNQDTIRAPIHFSIAANVGNSIFIDNLRIFNVEDLEAGNKALVIEAESGQLGSDYTTLTDDTITYITTLTNFINGGNPGSSSKITTFEITFPDTGTYDFFAKVRVNANGFDDDSWFFGNGFGEKDSINDDDWITSNGLAAAGFSGEDEVVYEAGGLGNGIWKWVNLSRNPYQGEAAPPFTITADSLTKIFQIGGREDGLDIDKIAFGKSFLYYTVGNLERGEAGSTVLPGDIWQGPPLASNQPKFVGSVYSSSQRQQFEAYWNKVTPENGGKWGSVEGTRDVMNWTEADSAYALAKRNGFPFHYHVLIWGAQQPNWISALPPEEQLEEITEWFEAVAARYPDIDYLEVVNEPLPGHNPPDGTGNRANYKEALGGNGTTGWDWVINAFKLAREIFPETTKLMLNDYGIISSGTSTSNYMNIVRLLQAEGLIDIVAEQGHAFTTTAAVATMRRNLDSLSSTGLPIHITELDIDGPSDQIQLQQYQRIFPALYSHPGVEGITLWGWRPGLWRNDEGAYIINNNGSERPALVWLREYLDTVDVTVGVNDIEEVPVAFELFNNYPNPFNPTTTISFSLPERSDVDLVLVDVLGRVVKEIASGTYDAGYHKVLLNASDLSSGVYFYRLVSNGKSFVKKLMLLK